MATQGSDDSITDDSFVSVADADELREEGRIVARADGRALALFHHEGEFQAVDNRCPHMGFPLADGTVDDGILTCHWRIMANTGNVLMEMVSQNLELRNRGVCS
jgi:nitrite reductase/ring-hydroxylating ferredoxin subunit